jgi:hypothetical protein
MKSEEMNTPDFLILEGRTRKYLFIPYSRHRYEFHMLVCTNSGSRMVSTTQNHSHVFSQRVTVCHLFMKAFSKLTAVVLVSSQVTMYSGTLIADRGCKGNGAQESFAW